MKNVVKIARFAQTLSIHSEFCMLLVTLIAFKATMKKVLKEPMKIFKEIIQELKKRKFN